MADRKVGDITCELNEAIKEILIYKANLIKNSDSHGEHAKIVLREHDIISDDMAEEQVDVFVEVFKMGTIDGMIYDIGSALALERQEGVENWRYQDKRRDIVRYKFLEE